MLTFVNLTFGFLYWPLVSLCLWILPSLLAFAEPDDDWWKDDFEDKTQQVNEGELVFLTAPPNKNVHHHHNHIVVHMANLLDGWVSLNQCHRHLDPVPDAQIVYNKGRVKNLKILSSDNIHKTWVEGHTIQLRDIQANAKLCISAMSKSLSVNSNGTYRLNNGPCMRRFLDGYYPMRVTMEIEFPQDCLLLKKINPDNQEGFEVKFNDKNIYIDTWFEGRLSTEITFALKNMSFKNDRRCQY